MASPSTQPTTKPARGPNASRTYTYFPPAAGWRVASSAKQSAPSSARAPPAIHATKVSEGRPSCAATSPGVRKMPDPTMMPTTMASPSISRRDRFRSVMAGGCAPQKKRAQRAAPPRNPPHPFVFGPPRLPPPPPPPPPPFPPPPPPPPMRPVPPPLPPPFEPLESCLLLLGLSLSSGLNFQAPRMVVRGGGAGICS